MVARGIVFEIPWLTVKCNTFSDQMNWQFVQILMNSRFHSKLRVLDTDDAKWKTFLFSVQGKSACFFFFQGCCYFVLRLMCPVHEINAQTPIATILATHLLHEFIVNVKHRMDCRIGNPIPACRLIAGNNMLLLMEYVKLQWICRNMSPPSDFFES